MRIGSPRPVEPDAAQSALPAGALTHVGEGRAYVIV